MKRPECYFAAIAALQHLFPEIDRKVIAAEAVRMITHDPSFEAEIIGTRSPVRFP
jgi:hypothetical protein